MAHQHEPTTTRKGPAATRGYDKDRAQVLRRLARMEGQVRGIARMVERDEYCIDILQQTTALRAAVDAVSLLLMEDHVAGCLVTAVKTGRCRRLYGRGHGGRAPEHGPSCAVGSELRRDLSVGDHPLRGSLVVHESASCDR